jgi:hypothetical protein
MSNELETKFETAQQELVDQFKASLTKAAEAVISDLYTDLSNFATTDAHINYHNYLRDEFRESLRKEIAEENGHYSWAHSIRMELLEKYPEVLRNSIISDLQGKIDSLQETLEQLRRYR